LKSAAALLDGHRIKGHVLRSSEPTIAPQRIRPSHRNDRSKNEDNNDPNLSLTERLNDKVTPFWRLTYEEQVAKKGARMEQVVHRFLCQLNGDAAKSGSKSKKSGIPSTTEPSQVDAQAVEGISDVNVQAVAEISDSVSSISTTQGPDAPVTATCHSPEVSNQTTTAFHVPDSAPQSQTCPPTDMECTSVEEPTVLPIIPAPENGINDYRNKCELSIGYDPEGQLAVGFMLGLFRDGLTQVVAANECVHVTPATKMIAKWMTEYVAASKYKPYDRVSKTGNWRLVMTRTQTTGDGKYGMLLFSFHSLQ
jgi:hypothetical protein